MLITKKQLWLVYIKKTLVGPVRKNIFLFPIFFSAIDEAAIQSGWWVVLFQQIFVMVKMPSFESSNRNTLVVV